MWIAHSKLAKYISELFQRSFRTYYDISTEEDSNHVMLIIMILDQR